MTISNELKRVKVIFLENHFEFKRGEIVTLFSDFAKSLEIVKIVDFCRCSNCEHLSGNGNCKRCYAELFTKCGEKLEHWEARK